MKRLAAFRPGMAVIWAAFIGVLSTPLFIAAASPLQAWRDTAYIAGGMAGVAALSLLFAQPVLASGYLPGLTVSKSRRLHRYLGFALTACVGVHIGGLYLSSPMDVMDALLLVSPTPFSVYGVAATLAVALIALLAAMRRKAPFSPRVWRLAHTFLAVVIASATAVHAIMIDGAMGVWSKWLMSCLAVSAAILVLFKTGFPKHRA